MQSQSRDVQTNTTERARYSAADRVNLHTYVSTFISLPNAQIPHTQTLVPVGGLLLCRKPSRELRQLTEALSNSSCFWGGREAAGWNRSKEQHPKSAWMWRGDNGHGQARTQWTERHQETKGRTREHRSERMSEGLIMHVSPTAALCRVQKYWSRPRGYRDGTLELHPNPETEGRR